MSYLHKLGCGINRILRSKLPFRNLLNTNVISGKSKFSTFASLLDENHFKIVEEEKLLLNDLQSTLSSMNEDVFQRGEIDLLQDCSSRIVDFFTVVIVGEFNAGKSTLINSLLGRDYLKAGILPTTDKICILRHKSDQKSSYESSFEHSKVLMNDIEVIDIPVKWLDHITLIDTPGTNVR